MIFRVLCRAKKQWENLAIRVVLKSNRASDAADDLSSAAAHFCQKGWTGAITDARLAQGVERFLIRLADGRKVEVPHPDFIAVGGNVAVVLDQHGLSKKIDAHHIVSIEDRPAKHRKPGSGRT